MWTRSLNRDDDKNYERFAAAQSCALSKVVIAVNQSRDRMVNVTETNCALWSVPHHRDLRIIMRRNDVALATNNEYLAEENW
jgi:hypothetical protein